MKLNYINYTFIARSLIALLFVIAGIQKMIGFQSTVAYVSSLGIPAATLVTILVIIIEVPVALAFAWGYRTCLMGWILVGFVTLVILIVHRDFSQGANMVMALKNIAIIGGLVGVIGACGWDTCMPQKA